MILSFHCFLFRLILAFKDDIRTTIVLYPHLFNDVRYLHIFLILLMSLFAEIKRAFPMEPNSSSIFSTLCVNFLLRSGFHVSFSFLTLKVSLVASREKFIRNAATISNIKKSHDKNRKNFCFLISLSQVLKFSVLSHENKRSWKTINKQCTTPIFFFKK